MGARARARLLLCAAAVVAALFLSSEGRAGVRANGSCVLIVELKSLSAASSSLKPRHKTPKHTLRSLSLSRVGCWCSLPGKKESSPTSTIIIVVVIIKGKVARGGWGKGECVFWSVWLSNAEHRRRPKTHTHKGIQTSPFQQTIGACAAFASACALLPSSHRARARAASRPSAGSLTRSHPPHTQNTPPQPQKRVRQEPPLARRAARAPPLLLLMFLGRLPPQAPPSSSPSHTASAFFCEPQCGARPRRSVEVVGGA